MSATATNTTRTPVLGDRTYNILKWIAQIFLPGLGTFYYTLSGIRGFPNAEEIVGTIMAVDLFLGLLLGLSSKQYQKSEARFDGAINVTETEESVQIQLDIGKDPEVLTTQKEVLFKVNNETQI